MTECERPIEPKHHEKAYDRLGAKGTLGTVSTDLFRLPENYMNLPRVHKYFWVSIHLHLTGELQPSTALFTRVISKGMTSCDIKQKLKS